MKPGRNLSYGSLVFFLLLLASLFPVTYLILLLPSSTSPMLELGLFALYFFGAVLAWGWYERRYTQ